jgi:hypothetical protein
MGHSKLLYAVDEKGRYVPAPCNGWEAEEIVLDQAIAEYVRLAADAWQRVKAGQASSLEYHMYKQRMDLVLLAQSAGFFKWRVRRDLRPGAFAKLSGARRERYGDALGLRPAQLDALPDLP